MGRKRKRSDQEEVEQDESNTQQQNHFENERSASAGEYHPYHHHGVDANVKTELHANVDRKTPERSGGSGDQQQQQELASWTMNPNGQPEVEANDGGGQTLIQQNGIFQRGGGGTNGVQDGETHQQAQHYLHYGHPHFQQHVGQHDRHHLPEHDQDDSPAARPGRYPVVRDYQQSHHLLPHHNIHHGYNQMPGSSVDEYGAAVERIQTRPVDLGYIRGGQYSPQGVESGTAAWIAAAATHQDFFGDASSAIGRHNQTTAPLSWAAADPMVQSGRHFGAAGVGGIAAAMKWVDRSSSSSLQQNVMGSPGVSASGHQNNGSHHHGHGGQQQQMLSEGRPDSSMSSQSKLCSPSALSTVGVPGGGGSDTSAGSFIPDETLQQLSVKDLNKRVSTLARDDIQALKQRRRTLKNRGYAMNCRLRRQRNKEDLEVQVGRLKDELRHVRHELSKLIKEREHYKSLWEKERFQNSMQHNNNNPASGSAKDNVGSVVDDNFAVTSAVAADHPTAPLNVHVLQHASHHVIDPHGSHHPVNERLVDLRLPSSAVGNSTLGCSNPVEDYKRAYAANAAAASLAVANDLKLANLR